MKNIIYIFTLLIFSFFSFLSNGQNCEHFAFTQGAFYEMEHYDAKNKKTGSSKSKVKEVISSDNKKTAVIHTETYDAKDKKADEADIKLICEGNKILVDLSSYAKSMGNEMKDMEMKIEASFMEIPSELVAGQSLQDGKMTIKMLDKKTGDLFATTTILITDRKVEGKQTITTPAGTFETWKISYNIKIETALAMGIKMPGRAMKSVEYYSKEAGTVRTEELNKKGEVEAYSILTRFSKQ
jgi:hypothetical protein